MIFCDTSTVAKLYVPEKESLVTQRRLESEDEVGVSELLRPELFGVFHRRLRETKWTQAEFQAAIRQFTKDDLGGFWTWLPLDSTIVEAATSTYTTLAPDVFLRTADCIHLVTALKHGFAEIYTHDRHQLAAASALGLRPLALG